MKPRFLLDEHINRAVQRQLRRLDIRIDVLAIGDSGAPNAGTPDPDILDWLGQNSYILVTRNRRTIPAYLTERWAAGRHIPGIFWIRPGVGIGRVIEELYLIWVASAGEEYKDRALFIPL